MSPRARAHANGRLVALLAVLVCLTVSTALQAAGDVVREHRHGISPTYGDLLAGGRFDPTNPTQLSYAQALNLENYLYLAVASFGVFTVVKGVGAFMIVTGLGLGITGYGLYSRE